MRSRSMARIARRLANVAHNWTRRGAIAPMSNITMTTTTITITTNTKQRSRRSMKMAHDCFGNPWALLLAKFFCGGGRADSSN